MKTISLNANTVDKKWVIVDATDQVLGTGSERELHPSSAVKQKPTFTPHVDCGDNVIIINASKAQIDWREVGSEKFITTIQGFPGGIKSATARGNT